MHGSISGLFCLSTLILDQVLNGGSRGGNCVLECIQHPVVAGNLLILSCTVDLVEQVLRERQSHQNIEFIRARCGIGECCDVGCEAANMFRFLFVVQAR